MYSIVSNKRGGSNKRGALPILFKFKVKSRCINHVLLALVTEKWKENQESSDNTAAILMKIVLF